MQVTVLGLSEGIQSADSGNSSLLIQTASTSVLVDVSGSPCTELLRHNTDPNMLDAVILTHAHVDHIYALPSLLHNLWLRKRTKPLFILANPHTIQKAQELCALFLLHTKKDMMPIRWGLCENIGNIKILSFPLSHRPLVPTNGFVFEAGGRRCSYFPDNAAQKPYPLCAADSDLLIHESNGLACEQPGLAEAGHSSAQDAAEVASELRAKRLMLIHVPGDLKKRAAILAEARLGFSSAELPEAGKTYTL
ncbi:MBL fold metallo-hydrolase [Treponema sp. HNW]|uniref:MBL fold metallo-hydrolase n=1 Tax=Treponema sp. HNW TaxID=3116654 RepID=UPI003D0F14E1